MARSMADFYVIFETIIYIVFEPYIIKLAFGWSIKVVTGVAYQVAVSVLLQRVRVPRAVVHREQLHIVDEDSRERILGAVHAIEAHADLRRRAGGQTGQ